MRPTAETIPNSAEWGADGIDHRGLLANKQMPCAVKHQAALLRRRLGGHKPHVGSGDSLTSASGGLIIGWTAHMRR